MRIIIVGLRRSGTTIFWESFRRDARLRCVNEPFNPALTSLPEEIPNRSRREVIEIFRKDPDDFWRRFAPIGIAEELQSTLSDRQAAYLRFLMDGADGFCTDVTRCHFKLAALKPLVPDAALVHLHRAPAAFASSHLVPTGSGGHRGNRVVRALGRVGFFTRGRRFDYWGMQTLTGGHPESLFGRRLREIGMDPEPVLALPAVGRLLAFWRLAWETVERDGPRHFGERFVSVAFEDFCREPRAIVERVYAAAGGSPPDDLDLSRVQPAKPAFRAGDSRWQRLFEQVGLSPDGMPVSRRP